MQQVDALQANAVEWFELVNAFVATYALGVLGGVLVLVVGWTLAGWARRLVDRVLGRVRGVDETLRRFFSSATRYLIIVITVLAALAQFGVQTASLIAVFGAASLAVGLALQGTLSNLAAGVMLLLFRPLRIGDYVAVGGHAGTVKAIDLFVTELATLDNVQVIVPNGQIWGAAITNYSVHATRRIEFTVGIDYADSIATAIDTVRAVIAADARCLADPEPAIMVNGLGESSVDIVVRVWCARGDFVALRADLLRASKEALDRAGISIPFPQRVVHTVAAKATAA